MSIATRRFPVLQKAEGDGGAGGGGVGAGGAGPGGAGGGGGTPQAAWYGNDSNKALVEAKGFKSVDDVFLWGTNAEKLIGAERAGRTLIRPKDDKDAEGIKAWRVGIGVPEKPDDYGLPVPDGQDAAFSKTAAGWMHEIGIGKAEAVKLTEKWNTFLAEQVAQIDATLQANSEKELEGLKTKWGGEFDKKSEEARRFMKTSGWTDDEVKRFESAMGTAFMLEKFQGLGSKMGEAGFVKGDGSGGGGMTKQQALDKIADLDAKRIAGNITAKDYQEQIDKLGPIAYAA